jgi:hypothetical protein
VKGRQTITIRISKQANIKSPTLKVNKRASKALRPSKIPNEHKLKSLKRPKEHHKQSNHL